MKKIVSLVCALALMMTMSVTVFAAENNGSEITTALQQTFRIGDNVYSLPSSTVDQIGTYLSQTQHQITSAQADDYVVAINDAVGRIKSAVTSSPTHDSDLKNLSGADRNYIQALLNNVAPSSFLFSTDGTNIIIVDGAGNDESIAIPSLDVAYSPVSSDHPNHNSDTEESAPAQGSGTVNTSTDASGATTVAVTPAVDSSPVVTGSTASFGVTIPAGAADVITTATAQNPATVTIAAPSDTFVNQLNTSAATSVAMTVAVPPQVLNNTNPNVSIALNLGQAVLNAAKQTQKDLTIGVVDSLSKLEIYSWTFKGADLAKSAGTLKDVNMALGLSNTAANSAVSKAVPSANKGLLLGFANNGELPAPATIRVFAVDRFPGAQALYLYYYNDATKQLETVDHPVSTVDSMGYANLTINHCSQYVLLPQQVAAASPVKLDTGKNLTVKSGKTYQFKLTASSKPTFASGNNSVFKVAANGSKGNNYFFTVTAVGKAGQGAGFYLNGEKSPRTVGTIVK